MILTLQRQPSYKKATFGNLAIDGDFFCHTLEDEIREVPGQPVEMWKVHGESAIPAGRYQITLEYSPKFGPDTITVNGVPGFVGVRVHGGNDIDDTEGCPIVGSMIDREAPRIFGAQTAGVLRELKAKIRAGLNRGDVWIDVVNP
jgi:hypothetical protein